MKSLTIHSLKFILLPALFVLAAIGGTVYGQDARLRLDRLNRLEERAVDIVEVNIEGKLLDMAKRVLSKSKDPNAQKVGQAINGLRGIHVRVFNFANENEYNVADVEDIRAQLSAPGWERLVNVRSKRNNQKIDVYTMFQGEVMSGVAVVVSESKSIALINVIGPIDIDLLAEMSGKLNIPRIDIERSESRDKPKN
ncbi:MAG TPA: DUF4252 domain-containing protein [Pyrinomonadaceae bacterium]|nr:DUF4252 domain-containing protein [Pyrinomonadaceae bacterium]